MKKRLFFVTTVIAIGCTKVWAQEPAKITYDDHIKPILREHCTSCHNANDKKSGLALDSYQGLMAGGSGGEVVVEGDLDSSRLYALTAHKEQPYMPPNQDMIAQAKVDLLKTWIEQGMPENSGSEIKKPKANAMALSVKIGRPEGAPPMPTTVLKQTPFATQRAATTSAIAASPWSPLVAVGGQMQVSLYHSETGKLLGVLPFPEGEPQSITFSRDGKLILIGGGKHSHSGYAALYEIETGNRIARVGDELDIVLSADINDNNQLIALAGPQKLIRVYDTLSGELKYEQKKHTDWVYAVRFSPDGLLLASADRSAGLVVWEADSGRLYLDLQGHKGEIRSLAWRPDSAALISASLDGTLKMWEMNEGKIIKSWDAHGGGAMAVDVCNDGTMVSTGRDNKVKVWDIGGNAAGEMPALVEAGHEIAITVDAKQIAAGDWAGNVRLWQRANPKDERSIPANPQPLESLLAAAQAELQQAVVKQIELGNDYAAKSSQITAIQQQLTELQSQLTKTEEQLKGATEKQTQLKPGYESLSAMFKTKTEELQSLRSQVAPRQKLIEVAGANKKKLDEEASLLTKQKAEPGADAASLDAKLQTTQLQIAIQVAALTQIQEEVAPLAGQLVAREQEMAVLQPKFEAISKEWMDTSAAVNQLTEMRKGLAPRLESTTAALKTASDAAAAAKAQVDSIAAQVATLQARVTELQSDLQAFHNRPAELASKKTSIEQSLAAIQQQIPVAESSITETKTQADALAAEIGKLEMQLAELQKRMADEQAKKMALNTAMNTKQESLGKLKDQASQLESDAAASSAQLELFQQAYGKKQ